MSRIICIVAIVLLVLAEVVYSSMTVCDCESNPAGCRLGEVQKGSCTVGGRKFPRCCKTTGEDDHCKCKGRCRPYEYQKDTCSAGYVCCPRSSRGYDPYQQW